MRQPFWSRGHRRGSEKQARPRFDRLEWQVFVGVRRDHDGRRLNDQVNGRLSQGIEVAVKQSVPEIVRIVDAVGTNLYYEPAKK